MRTSIGSSGFWRIGEDEYLARSWLIDPSEVEVKATPKKRRAWNQRDFYVSFGQGPSRHWEDARRYGFIAGGGDPWYSRTLNALKEGHRVFVHIPGKGYVGVGKVMGTARPIKAFTVETAGREMPILEADLKAPNMDRDVDDPAKCEYLVPIEWIRDEPVEKAFWEPNAPEPSVSVASRRRRRSRRRYSSGGAGTATTSSPSMPLKSAGLQVWTGSSWASAVAAIMAS